MKVGDHVCEARHDIQREAPLLRHAVVEPRLVEAAHDEHPFDNLPLPASLEFSIIRDSYGDNL